MKKISLLFLVFLLCLSLLACGQETAPTAEESAQEAESSVSKSDSEKKTSSTETEPKPKPIVYAEGLDYEVIEGTQTCMVTGMGSFEGTELHIPSTIDSYTVVAVKQSAFEDNHRLTVVSFPDTLKEIRHDAFRSCSNITEITSFGGTESIGYRAFYRCSSLQEVLLPDSVTDLQEAFEECSSLYRLAIGDGVESIRSYTFSWCPSLVSVELGANVKTIEQNAFSGCFKICEVINHSSLPLEKGSDGYGYIAYNAMLLHDGSGKIVQRGNYLFFTYEKQNYLIGYLGSSTELVLPANYNGQTYEIRSYAFYNCDFIRSVTMGDFVTAIGSSAFYDSDSLFSITLGKNITRIDSEAFKYCEKLAYVEIPNGIEEISSGLFDDCWRLRKIVIPSTVRKIQKNAFWGDSLEFVYFGGTQAQWSTIENLSEIENRLSHDSRETYGKVYFYSEETPTTTGNYWHYVNGVPTVWNT